MHALIDADIFRYEMGSAIDDEGFPLKWPLIQARLDERIWGILDSVEAESWQGYLTGKGNFRDHVATILPYKGTRDRGSRPFHWTSVSTYLIQSRHCVVVDGMEADDAISIEQVANNGSTIICSRDKDLRMVPGWHYTWPSWKQEERFPYYVTEIDGLRFFYTQLLVGDRSDNILGLHGVGPKARSVGRLQELSTEEELFEEVAEQYRLRFGGWWPMFMIENGRLLWMKRSMEDDWKDRFDRLVITSGIEIPTMNTGTSTEICPVH